MNPQIRSLFPVTRKYIYLNHAAVSPLSTRARDAMISLADDVAANGSMNYYDWCDTFERTRASAARLVNARPHEIAFVKNTSDAISIVANGLNWREGDNMVTCNVEFPANVYPWMNACRAAGATMRMADERNGRVDAGEICALADERTRVISISWVQFASGFRSDLAAIGRFCRDRDILFVVDVIQGLGGLKLDVESMMIDACAADAHKYLLGPEGIGILYVSDRAIDRIRPTVVGWMSVRGHEDYLNYDLDFRQGAGRFECGTLNTAGVYGLGAALDLFLEIGPETIEEHLIGLNSYLSRRLAEKGYEVAGSQLPSERSAIVTCTHPRHTPAALYERLKSRNIITAHRINRLRVAPHMYNTTDDLERLLEALPD